MCIAAFRKYAAAPPHPISRNVSIGDALEAERATLNGEAPRAAAAIQRHYRVQFRPAWLYDDGRNVRLAKSIVGHGLIAKWNFHALQIESAQRIYNGDLHLGRSEIRLSVQIAVKGIICEGNNP